MVVEGFYNVSAGYGASLRLPHLRCQQVSSLKLFPHSQVVAGQLLLSRGLEVGGLEKLCMKKFKIEVELIRHNPILNLVCY